MKKNKFKFRAFTALIVLWSFIVENVTGIVLYIVPPGRIAHWTNWKLWGFTKEQWAALHTIFGYIFLIFAVIHIYYNWKAILNYIKQKIKAGLRMRTELAVSLAISILVFVATAISIPPFSTVMDFGEKMKNSWEESSQEPFIPHAELMNLEELTKQIGMPMEKAKRILENNGIIVQDTSSSLQDIAKDNNTSPARLYEILKTELPSEEKEKLEKITTEKKLPMGGGYGWKTLENLAQELDIPILDIMAFLKSEGIDAKKNEVIRNIAQKNGLEAHDLVDMIQKIKE
ncbi:MAG: DUF4405 domain-containing protein [Candidatus Aminicenantes bacterium]|nr:MAG: DUF4405 domain-containing protein [Candidatus Aminicenantes bacterium]